MTEHPHPDPDQHVDPLARLDHLAQRLDAHGRHIEDLAQELDRCLRWTPLRLILQAGGLFLFLWLLTGLLVRIAAH